MVDPGFERSVRRWLRAYPRRWRVARSDEVLGTLADLAAPGATRLDHRSALGLLVGGLRTRVRTGPPLYQRIGYMFGMRISPRYLDWMADDLAAPLSTSSFLSRIAFFSIYGWLAWSRGEVGSAIFLFVMAVFMGFAEGIAPASRRAKRLRLLLPVPGDPIRGPRWVEVLRPRERQAATDAWAATALCFAWVTTAGFVGWLRVRPQVPAWGGLRIGGVALLIGLCGAAMATWRWRRWSRRGPEQPNRVVLRWRAQSVVMTSAFGAMVTWIATGALGSLTAAFSAGMVVAGVVMLPGALAAWRWSAGAPEDLAAVDLLWVAATGRPPKQDQRVPAAVPAGSPEAQHGTSLVDLVRIDPDRSALG